MSSVTKQEVSWSSMLEELIALHGQGIRFTKVEPECFARLWEQVGTDANGSRTVPHRIPPTLSSVSFEMCVPTPLWRLGAVAPSLAIHCGGALPCSLRVTVSAEYPSIPLLQTRGGRIELNSPGTLGKHAARILTQAAQTRLRELQSKAGQILEIVDWLQNTEVYEFAASTWQLDTSKRADVGCVRAFLRFHHVLCSVKQCYMQMWAEDLGVGALLAAGQPAMLLVEGPKIAAQVFLDRVTKVMHWGPTPARLVSSAAVYKSNDVLLAIGLRDVANDFPNAVLPHGTYNQRDCIDFSVLSDALQKSGHVGAAAELRSLQAYEFAHVKGRVKESANGRGWVGYASPEPELSRGGDQMNLPKAALHEVSPAMALGTDDFDPELAEAVRRSLGDVGGIALDLTQDTAMDAEDDPELLEAIRMSLSCSSDIVSAVDSASG